MLRHWFIPIFTVYVFAKPAYGFDSHLEYRSFDANEASALDDPRRIDSEYQSDFLTFSPRLTHEAQYFSRPIAFSGTVGSLSGREFMNIERLRAETNLTDSVRFRFVHFSEEDYEEDFTRSIVELQKDFASKLAFALYGDPGRRKEDVDVGAAIIYSFSENHSLRLFHTWPDFTREKRNLSGDVFIAKSNPTSVGFSGRYLETERYLYYAFRRDLPGHLLSQELDTTYSHAMTVARVDYQAPLREEVSIETQNQWDKKDESLTPFAATPTVSMSRTRLQSRTNLIIAGNNLTWRPGIMYASRRWVDHDKRVSEHRNWLPNVWVDKGPWSVGLEATRFESIGDPSLNSHDENYRALESRLNVQYAFKFNNGSYLSLLVSGDLDEFGSSHMFEGGNGQLLILF